jgi:peptidoglycan L-alanyl-D-glutamate endopeptidase CwlK
MMLATLDARSEKNLRGVNANLVAVVRRAAELVQERDDGLGFIVTEGMRTEKRQAELVKAGASRTMNSRHLIGQAVDLAATVRGAVRWDWPLYGALAVAMKAAAAELGVAITWGGDWRTFRDGPHFQIEPDVRKA